MFRFMRAGPQRRALVPCWCFFVSRVGETAVNVLPFLHVVPCNVPFGIGWYNSTTLILQCSSSTPTPIVPLLVTLCIRQCEHSHVVTTGELRTSTRPDRNIVLRPDRVILPIPSTRPQLRALIPSWCCFCVQLCVQLCWWTKR